MRQRSITKEKQVRRSDRNDLSKGHAGMTFPLDPVRQRSGTLEMAFVAALGLDLTGFEPLRGALYPERVRSDQ
jgi:hypothetical protein